MPVLPHKNTQNKPRTTSVKRHIINTIVILFALIGFGETWKKTTGVLEMAIEKHRFVSEYELIKAAVCKTEAGKIDPACKK